MFNPHAPSNRQSSITQSYRRHELEKKRAYEQRIREVEHASFTPLVLSACGGLATGASTFYKRLASLLAEKWEQPYSITISWLRCTQSFSRSTSTTVCYSMHPRCALTLWACCEKPTSGRPGPDQKSSRQRVFLYHKP